MNRIALALSPNLLLRLEDIALFTGTVYVYSRVAPDWVLFALLFFVPDVFMLGYLRDAKLGSLIYNIGHLLVITLGLVALGFATGSTLVLQIGLIWTAHIAFDRVMGYGLKYPTFFKDTHMQRV